MAGITLKTGRRRTSVPISVIRRAVEVVYSRPRRKPDPNEPVVNVIISNRMPPPKKAAIRKAMQKKRGKKSSA